MKRGFTLIELLVVIAVIAMLVAILLPSLNTAKGLARRAACASSLRNLGMAVNFYADTSDAWLPSAEPRNREPISPLHWYMNQSLLQHVGVPLAFDADGKLIGPAGKRSALTCPSHNRPTHTRPRTGEPTIVHEYGLSYGMNGTFGLGGRPDHSEYRRFREFKSPSHVCALSDCWGTSLGPAVVLYHACVRDNLVYRHLDTANVCFLDAHVEALSSEDVPMGFANRYDPFWSAAER